MKHAEARERRVNLKLPPEVHRALRLRAAELDTSIQELVEQWIRQHLDQPAAGYEPLDHGSTTLQDSSG